MSKTDKLVILGAGLAGLSASYHSSFENTLIFEKRINSGGHATSHFMNDSFWDEGPHISFTKNKYVKELFAASTKNEFDEFEFKISNWFQGKWITHPVQVNLRDVPIDIRENCLSGYLRRNTSVNPFLNYDHWLNHTFGEEINSHFFTPYTRKYWTCNPDLLATDWIHNRILKPSEEDVVNGYSRLNLKKLHYINKVRYPRYGGFNSFCAVLRPPNILFDHEVVEISLTKKTVLFSNGLKINYAKLINTLPLPEFIHLVDHVPSSIVASVKKLKCTSLFLVNIESGEKSIYPYHLIYNYDEAMFSTRITQKNLLVENTHNTFSQFQVEVYFSKLNPQQLSNESIAKKVGNELVKMGLIKNIQNISFQSIPYANIIFDLEREEAQSNIFSWLESFGLCRENDDLDPLTDWEKKRKEDSFGDLILAGRFAQWKYFWSDDCVLRGKFIFS